MIKDKNFFWMLVVVGFIAASQLIGYTILGFIIAVGALISFVLIYKYTDKFGEIKRGILK